MTERIRGTVLDNDKNEKMAIKLEKDLNSPLFPICYSLVMLGPYSWLIISILNNNYKKALSCAILSFPCIIIITIIWAKYFRELKDYKKKK